MKQSSIRLNRSLFIDSVRQARKILEFFVIKIKKIIHILFLLKWMFMMDLMVRREYFTKKH